MNSSGVIGASCPAARHWTVLLRRAQASDALQVAEVHVSAWQAAYHGLLPEDYLDALQPEDRARTYRFDQDDAESPITVVAVDGGVVRGFTTIGRSLDDDLPGNGQLYAIYVDPTRWRSGIGRLLIIDARARLADQGFSFAQLWSMVGNDRAEGFYRSDGWEADGARRLEEIHGVMVDAVRFVRVLEGD